MRVVAKFLIVGWVAKFVIGGGVSEFFQGGRKSRKRMGEEGVDNFSPLMTLNGISLTHNTIPWPTFFVNRWQKLFHIYFILYALQKILLFGSPKVKISCHDRVSADQRDNRFGSFVPSVQCSQGLNI